MKFLLGDGAQCDLSILLESRLLVQCTSGGGKSWALRRILEQTHGKVQQLVIDPEGEFATLRANFDYVLGAKTGGDTAAIPRAAKLLAERLLGLNASAILDIYELHADERIAFVKLFLEALVDAPKKLWHPCLIVIDEAHVFAPEQSDAESRSAVIDLITRGRKRGFGTICATQRLSKFAKDAAAECKNKLIGGASLDLDMKRAADELGFAKSEMLALRDLAPGEFWCFGPAIGRTPTKVLIGDVQSEHPKPGSRHKFVAPVASAKIMALLPQLADLPAEAEVKAKTEADLRREIATLRRELSVAKKGAPFAPAVIEKPVHILKDGQLARVEKLFERAAAFIERARETPAWLNEIPNAVQSLASTVNSLKRSNQAPPPPSLFGRPAIVIESEDGEPPTYLALPDGEAKILQAIVQHGTVERDQLSILTGYKKSTRNAYLSRLLQRGLIREDDSRIRATREGMDANGPVEALPTGHALFEWWMQRLPEGEAKTLRVIHKYVGEWVDRNDLQAQSGYKKSTSNAYVSRLVSRGLVNVQREGVSAARELYD